MGILVGIGQWFLDIDDWCVPLIKHPLAPIFIGDGEEPQTNYRKIDYLSWKDFLNETQIISFNKSGPHRITNDLLNVLENCKTIRQTIVGLPAGFLGEPGPCVYEMNSTKKFTHDWHLARLEWMIWWCNWAQQNCTHPVLWIG